MMDKQDGHTPAAQLQQPCLHGLPRLRFIFLAGAAQGSNVVQHHHVHTLQKRLNHGLPTGCRQIRHGTGLQVRCDERHVFQRMRRNGHTADKRCKTTLHGCGRHFPIHIQRSFRHRRTPVEHRTAGSHGNGYAQGRKRLADAARSIQDAYPLNRKNGG